jgi:dolichol kinase
MHGVVEPNDSPGIVIFVLWFGPAVTRLEKQIWPVTIPFIKTYRLPTPLLIFQMALIAGSLLTGFLLFPLLVLSRHIAQRPVRKLRFPQEREIHRKGLALGFYVGAVAIIGGPIGLWTRWCLGNRDPWIWAIFWLLEGRKKWSRPLLLAYWLLLGSISVAGWNRQLARFRRYRRRDSLAVPNSTDNSATPSIDNNSTTPISGSLGLTFPNLPNLPNSATDLLDAADKRVPTLSLNARRKFFHALAVVMFLPGVAFDVCNLSSSIQTAANQLIWCISPHLHICLSVQRSPCSHSPNMSDTLPFIRSMPLCTCS